MAIVYKYGSISKEWDTGTPKFLLEDKTLMFSSPGVLNDVNECTVNVGAEVDAKILHAIDSTYDHRTNLDDSFANLSPEMYREIIQSDPSFSGANLIIAIRSAWHVAHRLFSRFGILSLTKANDNLLLWAHYCGGQCGAASGICIGFNSDADVFTSSEYKSAGLAGMYDVQYQNERPSLAESTRAERLARLVLTKSKEWCYEQEVRCIRELDEDEGRRPVSFAAEDVHEVILGPNMLHGHMEKCFHIVQSQYPHANLYVALPDPAEYRMKLLKCDSQVLLQAAMADVPKHIKALRLDGVSS